MKGDDNRFSLWAAGVTGAALAIALLAVAGAYFASLRLRTPISALRDLPPSTPVHLVGVVTYADEADHRFWLEGETGVALISLGTGNAGVRAGQTIAVDARKMGQYDPAVGPASLSLRNVRVHSSTAHIKLPPPFPATIADFPQPEKDGARIEVEGVVEEHRTDAWGRVCLSLTDAGKRVAVTVADPSGDYAGLLDARVRVIGVADRLPIKDGILAPHLWVPSGSGVQLLAPPPKTSPLDSIRDLFRAKTATFGHRVRVRGRVAAIYPRSILLEDPWGAIEVNLAGPPRFRPGASVEAVGFPYYDGLRIDLEFSQAAEIPAAQLNTSFAHIPAAIATALQLRKLSARKAAQALPVQIDGVVTYYDPIWNQMYVQDSTGGIYVKYSGSHPELHAGERVRLTGLSSPGDYAPVIVGARFVAEGPGALPVPIPATSELAAAGLLDSQFVSLEGIVHPLKFAEKAYHPVFTFDLYTALGQIHAYASPGFPDLRKSHPIDDARVRIQGVFSTVFNSRRQLVGYQLQIAEPANIQVLEPAVADPLSVATSPIGSLLRFSPGSRFGHRVKISGTVTLAGNGFVYAQDQSGGVEVRGDAGGIHLGQRIEAVGYPTLVGRYSPVLTDAMFRAVPGSGAIQPQSASAESILHGKYDSQLVTLQGRLLTVVPGPGSVDLLLQSGIQTFTAELDTSGPDQYLPDLRVGSILRLTGVASAQIDPNKIYQILQTDPVSFRLLLRVPRDITVIRAAPFWTSEKTLAVLAVLALLIVAILAWVAVLRRRVARQRVALARASQTAQAVHDLAAAMEKVSADQKFDTQVSVRGSSEIAGLVVGFNSMLAQLLEKDNARRDAESRLKQLAMIDELTGLPNRRLLADRLAQSMARARREQSTIGFLYIDLDGFKLVNDSFGHAAGDRLLTEVGQRLHSSVRPGDMLSRIGGDEFTVTLHRIDSRDDAESVAESVLRALVNPFYVEGHEIAIGASIGISIFPDPNSDNNDDLLQQADSAMYAAKRNGKNQIVHFSKEIGDSVRERLTLENELRRAIANREIQVHYQPEFDLATNAIVRFEALARWSHPDLGVIPPLRFIPIAEDCGLIVPLGINVMERACRDALLWQQQSGHPIQVAVNVSSVQFARDSFVAEVVEVVERTGLPAHLLQIELTESVTLIGIERAAAIMRQLKELGIGVVMDDFGSGYSSLSYLPKFPFDALKIDRSFVNELPASSETRALVQSILTLGHNLGMKIVVEGIENQAQLELMRELGADEAQGYLLGRPTPDPSIFLRRNTIEPQAAASTLPVA